MTTNEYETLLDPVIDVGGSDDDGRYTPTVLFDDEDGIGSGPMTAPDGSRLVGRDRLKVAQAAVELGDLVAAGHGFSTESYSRAAELPTHCHYCGDPLPLPEDDTPCEFATLPWAECHCNSCTSRRFKLKRDRGRPRTQCGARDCERHATNERKRRSRRKTKKLADQRTPAMCHV